MSDPNVNIFEALKRMGTKIPFRFPMIDTLVPTVQMFDVSRLVSAPVEPRAVAGDVRIITLALGSMLATLQSLAPGGLFVEFLALSTSLVQVAPIFWDFLIRPMTVGGTPRNKENVGGTATDSVFRSDEIVHDAALTAAAVNLPGTMQFATVPRFFVPPGRELVLQSPQGMVADIVNLTIAWAELPASFEQQ